MRLGEGSAASGKRVGVVLILVSLVLAVYWPVGSHPFTGYDDPGWIPNNPRVAGGLTAGGLAWAFTNNLAHIWHPLVWLSYMLDVELFGMNPGAMHLVNLLLHALGTVVLFLALRSLTGSLARSALVAALFGVHPLHVESVAWIAERKDVLSGLFWMLALAAYARYVRRPGPRPYLALLAAFLLGLLSKPMVVTLPFVLLLLDYWPLGRLRAGPGAAQGGRGPGPRALLLEKAPLFLAAGVFGLLAVATEGRGGTLGSIEELPLLPRAANAALSWVWYVGKTLWPSSLAVYYPHPGEAAVGWGALAAAVVLVLATGLALGAGRRRPALVVGWLWYLGTILPVVGLVQFGAFARADRFAYLPSIGLFVVAAWAVRRRPARARGRLLPLAACGAVLLYAVAGRVQVGHWRDDETLFGHALAVTRDNWMMENNLGVTLLEQGRVAEAVPRFREALRLAPGFGLARLNLGRSLARLGRDEEAERVFREALRLEPRGAEALFSLGRHLQERGRAEEAIPLLAAAIELAPDLLAAYEPLGLALSDRGDAAGAAAVLRRGLARDPGSVPLRLALGWATLRAGRGEEAVELFREALAARPSSAAALNGLGTALAAAGRHEEALARFEEALRLDPGNRVLVENRALLLRRLGR